MHPSYERITKTLIPPRTYVPARNKQPLRPPIQEVQDKVGTYEACGVGDKDNLVIIRHEIHLV